MDAGLPCDDHGLWGDVEPGLAWGCVAVDSQGAYGYSNNWPSEQDAELTALQQCDRYTKTNDCQTQSCDHDAGG